MRPSYEDDAINVIPGSVSRDVAVGGQGEVSDLPSDPCDLAVLGVITETGQAEFAADPVSEVVGFTGFFDEADLTPAYPSLSARWATIRPVAGCLSVVPPAAPLPLSASALLLCVGAGSLGALRLHKPSLSSLR